jgi:hypothetical protein
MSSSIVFVLDQFLKVPTLQTHFDWRSKIWSAVNRNNQSDIFNYYQLIVTKNMKRLEFDSSYDHRDDIEELLKQRCSCRNNCIQKFSFDDVSNLWNANLYDKNEHERCVALRKILDTFASKDAKKQKFQLCQKKVRDLCKL